jgi:hypothetical protein
MKKVIWAILLVALGCSVGHGQKPPSQTPSGQVDQEKDLSVTGEVANQTYCHSDSNSFDVQMVVELRFTNTSKEPVILPREIKSPEIIRVSKNVEAAKEGIFEYDPNMDEFARPPRHLPKFGPSPDSERFVVLEPGETYRARVVSGVVAAVNPSGGRGLLAAGAHVLQLGISTWPYPNRPKEIHKLRAEWHRIGHLETDTVYSDFFPLNIPERPNNPRCPGL